MDVGERAATEVADGVAVGGWDVSVGTGSGVASEVANWVAASCVWTAIVEVHPASNAARIANQLTKWRDVILVDTAQIIEY